MSVAAAALAGFVATTVAVAPSAFADTPAWEPDTNGNGGTLTFYDASGHQITGGTDLTHLFDYAAGSTAEDPDAFHKASLSFAYPDHLQPTSSWFVNGGTAAATYPVATAQNDLATVPADHPVAHPGPTEMNLSAALGAAVLDSTAGYANIVQIRMQQSGSSASYYTADISYDLGAGTWTEVFPAASSAVSTSTALGSSPAGQQAGGSPVTLTATVTPAAAAGTVQFKDGVNKLGSPVAVSGGVARLTTSGLTAGTHSLSAAFSPTDANAFAPSSSTPQSYRIVDNTSVTVSRSVTIRYGSTTTTGTVLKDTRTGKAIVGAPVRLYAHTTPTSAWSLVGTVTTSSTGAASKAVKPSGRTYYQWRYVGATGYAASTSATQTVSVSQVVAAAASPTKVRPGKTTKIYGWVSPSSSGQKVTLQRLYGKSWETVGTATVKKQKLPNGQTRVGYVFSQKLTSKATYNYRVYKPATPTLLAGYSSSVRVVAS
jgi:hypothetical protein